jgi:hypothetical protein
MTSIINYLTPKSAYYYERIRMIVDKLASLFEYNVVIYGGMVRDIISHYYEYQRDNSIEFIEPKDVDLHINMKPSSHWNYFSMNHYNYLMKKLWDNKIVELDKTDYRTIYQDNYTLVKFVIDGIQFDISANVNQWCIYDDITDYSVNCLNINSDNIIGVRGIDMEVEIILHHIENKELHNVLDRTKLKRYLDYYNNDVSVIQYYEDKIIERNSKMLNKGYNEI